MIVLASCDCQPCWLAQISRSCIKRTSTVVHNQQLTLLTAAPSQLPAATAC
ncbi:hypothetical protein 6939_0010 [Klebsiella phage 6939]|uniref:Uncharacterized protein n=1 Tax=Klebsiella phage 6939 TaxID=2912295 RepID=A0A9E7M7D9_9CAUD|nr:hypothetical protein 6939_0010 [Klebsiella phage 6939]